MATFFRYDVHEKEVGKIALEMGFEQVSLSSTIMPMVRVVPRGYTGKLNILIWWSTCALTVIFTQNECSLHSKRFRASLSRKLAREQKKKEMRGKGKGAKEMLACKPHDFEKLCSPTNAAFDWCGAGSTKCWLNSNQYINQTRYVLFTCVVDLVWSDLWSQITNALVWYLFESCLCEGLSDLSPFDQKYNWRSSSGD